LFDNCPAILTKAIPQRKTPLNENSEGFYFDAFFLLQVFLNVELTGKFFNNINIIPIIMDA